MWFVVGVLSLPLNVNPPLTAVINWSIAPLKVVGVSVLPEPLIAVKVGASNLVLILLSTVNPKCVTPKA